MSSLSRSTRTMAVGTVASRATGFVRTAAIAVVLGLQGVGDAFNLANTAPNIIYELLLGGILTSVVVPLLVRAARSDGDDGRAYTQRLLTLVVLGLGSASLLLVALAPAVVAVYGQQLSPADQDLAVLFARFLLPQVLFYGAGAVMGAYLNTRGRYGPPMWAPVLNNVVVIATAVVFTLLPGPTDVTAGTITDTQITVLGIGVTLGIVAQTLALLPALRATGLSLRPRFDLRGMGLRAASRLAGWVVVYVAASQLAYVVVVNLANAAGAATPGRGYAAYLTAFVLWQLPHAVVAVSISTALLPQMSRAAADGRTGDLVTALTGGLRLAVSVLVPAAVLFVVLGRDLAAFVFARGQVSVDQARFVGVLLGVFALGLVPFSCYQMMLRAFYAMQDTRTPTLVNLGVNAVLVVVDLLLFTLLPDDVRIIGLAAGHATSFVAGLALCSVVLSRRVRTLGGAGLDGAGLGLAPVVRVAVRCLLAALVAAVPAAALAVGVGALAGRGPLGAFVVLALAGPAFAVTYLLLARRMRVGELDELLGPVLSRLPGPLGRTP